MKIGPITFFDSDAVERALGIHDIEFEKSTQESSIYYEIPDDKTELIKPAMVKLGYWHEQLSDGSELDGEDYFCPKCNFHRTERSRCPTHNMDLIPMNEWNELRSKNTFGAKQIATLLALLAMAAFWIFGRGSH